MGLEFQIIKRWINSGYRCVLLKREFPTVGMSWFTGHVLIPRGHVLFGKEEDELNDLLVCHGGITFAGSINNISENEFKDLWAVGWDSAHGLEHTYDMAIKQTQYLARQINLIGLFQAVNKKEKL